MIVCVISDLGAQNSHTFVHITKIQYKGVHGFSRLFIRIIDYRSCRGILSDGVDIALGTS